MKVYFATILFRAIFRTVKRASKRKDCLVSSATGQWAYGIIFLDEFSDFTFSIISGAREMTNFAESKIEVYLGRNGKSDVENQHQPPLTNIFFIYTL